MHFRKKVGYSRLNAQLPVVHIGAPSQWGFIMAPSEPLRVLQGLSVFREEYKMAVKKKKKKSPSL